MDTKIRVSTESWPWRRKFAHSSCGDLNPGPTDHKSDTTELFQLPTHRLVVMVTVVVLTVCQAVPGLLAQVSVSPSSFSLSVSLSKTNTLSLCACVSPSFSLYFLSLSLALSFSLCLSPPPSLSPPLPPPLSPLSFSYLSCLFLSLSVSPCNSLQAHHDHNKIAPCGMIKVFWIELNWSVA